MKCLVCKTKLKGKQKKFCSQKHNNEYRYKSTMTFNNNKETDLPDKALDDYILSYCPNIDLPRKRSNKMIMIRDINFLKNKLPMEIPHPNLEGEKMIISLDTFMQGEKL